MIPLRVAGRNCARLDVEQPATACRSPKRAVADLLRKVSRSRLETDERFLLQAHHQAFEALAAGHHAGSLRLFVWKAPLFGVTARPASASGGAKNWMTRLGLSPHRFAGRPRPSTAFRDVSGTGAVVSVSAEGSSAAGAGGEAATQHARRHRHHRQEDHYLLGYHG